jgi:hypothetical protein
MKINKLIKYFLLLSTVVLLPLAAFSCHSPTGPNNYLNLTLEDVSCTEAWLKVTGETGSEVILNRDNIQVQKFTLISSPQTIYDDSLLPNKTYTYQAVLNNEKSSKITVTTLDTTSSNFTWQTYSFGDPGAGSSVFNDIIIVNDTLAYAVGEIYLNDTAGQPDPQSYSIGIWDGNEWQLKKIYDSNHNLIPSIRDIYTFTSSDIWLADGGVYHWNGTSGKVDKSFDRISLIGGSENGQSVNKLWGTSSNSLYGVGNGGMITYYNSNSWQKLESGTSTIITDIWGITNDMEKSVEYCAVSSFFVPGDKKILRIKGNKVDSVSWNVQRLLNSVWTNNEQFLYVCGSGTWENKKGYWEEADLPLVSMNAIRGNGLNDIFVVGDFGLVAHFNGVSWHVYNSLYNNNTGYGGLSVKGNIVMMTGEENGQGVITIGRRN